MKLRTMKAFTILRQWRPLVTQIRPRSTSAVTDENINSTTKDVKQFNEIPGPSGRYSIPYLGIAFQFKPFTKYTPNDFPKILAGLRENYGDIIKLRMGKDYVVLLYHPDHAKTIFQLPYKEYHRPPLDIMEVFSKRTGSAKSLSLLEGDEWAALRKPAQEKMLRPAVVRSYVPLIEQVTNDFVEVLREKKTVEDLLMMLMNYTTESVAMLCFNKRLGCINSPTTPEIVPHIQEFFRSFQESFMDPFKAFKYFRTPLYERFEKARLGIEKISKQEILEQRDLLTKLEKEGKLEEYLEKEPNFMYSLLADPRMTPDKVISIVTSLFAAGIDSTANSMVFSLTDLALNPEKQNKLYKEIQEVVGDSKHLTKEHLAEMPYLKACVKESQRKTFPLMMGTIRKMEWDIVLGGYVIPKNTMVQINMKAMALDERFFPRPNEYIPERWLRGIDGDIGKGQDFPFGMKPFGFGPRGCIGQRFAELELYIGISKIIQNFKISMPPGITEIKPVYRTFTSPAEKVVMHLTDRRNNKQDESQRYN